MQIKSLAVKRPALARLWIVAVTALALSASACTPMTTKHGNFLEDHQLQLIKPGEHTRSDVMRLIGSPTATGTFDESLWYYMGQQTQKKGVFDPEVIDERVIIVSFDEDGLVRSVSDREGGRLDVPITERRTPTHGNDITVIQQLLGNIGKFNPPAGGG
jgi:outer membrane protein assembly factor BamE (lipoprotein component of BamABCDE complex)